MLYEKMFGFCYRPKGCTKLCYRYHPRAIFYFYKSIVVTQRFFDLFKPNKKIHISRSMARILKNKPLLES